LAAVKAVIAPSSEVSHSPNEVGGVAEEIDILLKVSRILVLEAVFNKTLHRLSTSSSDLGMLGLAVGSCRTTGTRNSGTRRPQRQVKDP
jgi:hypothetical protein